MDANFVLLLFHNWWVQYWGSFGSSKSSYPYWYEFADLFNNEHEELRFLGSQFPDFKNS